MLRGLLDGLTKVLEENEYLHEELNCAENGLDAWRRDYQELQEENKRLREENTEWRQSYEALKVGDIDRRITRLAVENAELHEENKRLREEATWVHE